LNFNLQATSPCCGCGLNGFDIGAKFFHDVPEATPFLGISTTGFTGQVTLRWVSPIRTVHGNPLDTLREALIWRSDSLIARIDLAHAPDTLEYTDVIPRPDFFRYQVCVVDTMNRKGRLLYDTERWFGGPIRGILIWELDPTPISGSAIETGLREIGYIDEIYTGDYAGKYLPNTNVDAVFVCLGIYSNNHVLSSGEGQILKDYLDAGGNVYMEGGDTWYYDTQTPVHPMFKIHATSDGSGDLYRVVGQQGTVFEPFQFQYGGENAYMDHIEAEPLGQRILVNPGTETGIGVASSETAYKTVGTSFELGGLEDGTGTSTKRELLRRISEIFGLALTQIQVNSGNPVLPEEFVLRSNYPNPFNNTTKIEFGLPEAGIVEINIYNITGQRVFSENPGKLNGGWHSFTWNGTNHNRALAASGIYFYRISFTNGQGKKFQKSGKMSMMK